MTEDHRLSRLFTYTVFHLGMSIPLGAAVLTLIGSPDLTKALETETASPALWVIVGGILVAGIAGAVVRVCNIVKLNPCETPIPVGGQTNCARAGKRKSGKLFGEHLFTSQFTIALP